MARVGFYGVYGRNGGGVYTDWTEFETSKSFIPSVKVKKFASRKEAVKFIVDGLSDVYNVCDRNEIRQEELYSHTDYYLRDNELIDYSMLR